MTNGLSYPETIQYHIQALIRDTNNIQYYDLLVLLARIIINGLQYLPVYEGTLL